MKFGSTAWRIRPNMNGSASILYVEDNLENRILILRVLNAEGYGVDFAENATEALTAVQNKEYHLILMDINLPDIDGYTLTSTLRANARLTNAPIIALTANVMKGDRERSLKAGCDGYIQKPIDADALPQQIEVFLKR
jgi:two-component system cell cycle response regulator DivK